MSKINELLNLLKGNFEKKFYIENCEICNCDSRIQVLNYYIDNNRVIRIKAKFFCEDCFLRLKNKKK